MTKRIYKYTLTTTRKVNPNGEDVVEHSYDGKIPKTALGDSFAKGSIPSGEYHTRYRAILEQAHETTLRMGGEGKIVTIVEFSRGPSLLRKP